MIKKPKTWFATKEGKLYFLQYYGKKLETPIERPFILSNDGYLKIKLPRGKCNISVHKLIWEYFNGNIPKGLQINHKDGNKLNNSLSNLEVVTQQENLKHAMRMGLHCNPNQPIMCNETKQQFESQAEAAKVLKLHQANIHKVLTGKRPHTGGFTFKRIS